MPRQMRLGGRFRGRGMATQGADLEYGDHEAVVRVPADGAALHPHLAKGNRMIGLPAESSGARNKALRWRRSAPGPAFHPHLARKPNDTSTYTWPTPTQPAILAARPPAVPTKAPPTILLESSANGYALFSANHPHTPARPPAVPTTSGIRARSPQPHPACPANSPQLRSKVSRGGLLG